MFKRASEEDYLYLCKWYAAQSTHELDVDSTGKESYIYLKNNIPLSSMSLFHSHGSPVGMIAWLIVNPILKGEERSEAISKIINHITEVAEKRGAKGLVSYSDRLQSAKRLESNGFKTNPIMQYQSYKWMKG